MRYVICERPLKKCNANSLLVISAILVVVTAEHHARVHFAGKTGANGVVDLIQMNGGVQMNGRVNELTPGKHGFHVHE